MIARRPARLFLFSFLSLVLCAAPAATARAQHAPQDHGDHPGEPCPACPPPRESSGTSWQPDLAGSSHHWRRAGSWLLGTHLQVAATAIDERGPRGDRAVVAPNHGMLTLRRSAGGGTLAIRTMFSLDPLMGARGYPLLGQSGETADGINPLFDRQHPHDLVMELAAAWERRLASGATASVYVAAVGEPALGPPAFMHRPSARLLPTSPITHHWFDSTHITYGVVTVGLAPREHLRFEGSVFNGREPDQHRWGLEVPRFDSYSLRISINPTPSLAFQASAGVLNEPEIFHEGADVTRLTASVMYARRGTRWSFDGFAAVAHATRTAILTPLGNGFDYYVPGATSPAALVEGTLALGSRHHFIVRAEAARKGELFPADHALHLEQFAMARTTLAYALRVLDLPNARVHLGGAWSALRTAAALRAEYGNRPTGTLGFVLLELH